MKDGCIDLDEMLSEIIRLKKQNKSLGERCLQLQKDKGNLIDKINELEAQIEKMKVCQNCENWNWKHSKCEKKLKGDCFKHSKWVMRNF